mmetsp:Transcript_29392/g.59225  ORF Transcript_29392/g.59225 Transcript_29392/m.59225 type:complete len:254 (+) Transcript_29392:1188-1949(+)
MRNRSASSALKMTAKVASTTDTAVGFVVSALIASIESSASRPIQAQFSRIKHAETRSKSVLLDLRRPLLLFQNEGKEDVLMYEPRCCLLGSPLLALSARPCTGSSAVMSWLRAEPMRCSSGFPGGPRSDPTSASDKRTLSPLPARCSCERKSGCESMRLLISLACCCCIALRHCWLFASIFFASSSPHFSTPLSAAPAAPGAPGMKLSLGVLVPFSTSMLFWCCIRRSRCSSSFCSWRWSFKADASNCAPKVL